MHRLDLTYSLGDELLCVISACNDVCLSILQVSDSLAEQGMIQEAIRKASTAGGALAISPPHRARPIHAAQLLAGKAEHSTGGRQGWLLKVMWIANSSVGIYYRWTASRNACARVRKHTVCKCALNAACCVYV